LVQQFGQHGSITNPAASHLNCPDLQRIGINAKVDLTPLPQLGRPMFLGKPLPFALSFDPGAIDQQVQSTVCAVSAPLI
jgi:hypothetical protein